VRKRLQHDFAYKLAATAPTDAGRSARSGAGNTLAGEANVNERSKGRRAE